MRERKEGRVFFLFFFKSAVDETFWFVIERTTPWNTTCIWRFFRLNTSLEWCYFLLQDDRYFLSGSLDGKIRLWNIPDKKVALWNEVEGTGNYLHFFSWCLFSTIIFFNSAFWWQFVLNEMSPKRANLDWREVPPFHWGPSPKNKKKLVKKKIDVSASRGSLVVRTPRVLRAGRRTTPKRRDC